MSICACCNYNSANTSAHNFDIKLRSGFLNSTSQLNYTTARVIHGERNGQPCNYDDLLDRADWALLLFRTDLVKTTV